MIDRYIPVTRVIGGDDEAAEFMFSGGQTAERRKGKTGDAVLADAVVVLKKMVIIIIIF